MKIKKPLSILLILIIVFQVWGVLPDAYGATQIIDFSSQNDINYFEISAYHGWGRDYTRSDYNVYVSGKQLVFASSMTDLFPMASLQLQGAKKVEFKLKTSHSGSQYTWGDSFNIDFNDGTTIRFHPNMGSRAGFEYYGLCAQSAGYDDWDDGSIFKFIVKSITGNIVDLGKVNSTGTYTTYSIEIKNGILIMTSDLGYTFTEPIGNRRMTRIWFDPLRQWNCTQAKGYLDDVFITPGIQVGSISIDGQSSVEKGKTINLKATVSPAEADNTDLMWTSSDLSVATVDSIGNTAIVRGIKKGTVTITAAAQDGSGVTASKTITVTSGFVQGEASYILVDDIVEYQTGYSDAENDPKYGDEYKYIHNPSSLNGVTLDNVMGYVDFNDKWGDLAYKQFPKVGTYKIQYRVKDNPPASENNSNFANYRYYSDVAESTIYVHRKPIALYSINGSTVMDSSYDLDHSVSHPNKGIDLWEWQYVNSNGYTWAGSYGTAPGAWGTKQEGIDTVNYLIWLYSGVQYKIVLRVRDIEGAWSDPCIRSAGEISRPVADFVIEKNPMVYKVDTQKITDMSYDTNGLPLCYNWTVTKSGQVILSNTAQDISGALNQAINNQYPNVTGTYVVNLQVTNSAGVQSNIVSKAFDVIVHNQAPTADFELVSNESPLWSFPKVLGLHTLKYRPTAVFFHEEKTRFNVNVADPNSDNLGFNYNWKLERFVVKNIGNISGSAANTYNYTTQYPFMNSFKEQGLPWGAYRITLSATDKLPVPPYQSTDAKMVTVTKQYYIVPELRMTGSFEGNSEVAVGDTIKLKAITSKETENVSCNFAGTNYVLNKVSEDSNFAYWGKNIVVPDSISESGTYYLNFVGSTTYGGNGNITREIRDSVPIDIVALKLISFRITDIVNHQHVTFPYTKDMLINQLIPYKSGYYVTFKIDSKGKPDNVYGRIDIGNNGNTEQVISLTKVASGDTETWQGRFYTSPYLSAGTVISIKLDCAKGSTIYDYNLKENWNGRSLITNGSALQDGRVNLTN